MREPGHDLPADVIDDREAVFVTVIRPVQANRIRATGFYPEIVGG